MESAQIALRKAYQKGFLQAIWLMEQSVAKATPHHMIIVATQAMTNILKIHADEISKEEYPNALPIQPPV